MKGIYCIRNLSINKIYIGSAINLRKREINHFVNLKNNKHKNRYLQNAYNKYGVDSFIFEIIEKVEDKNKLIEREQYYIDNLKPEYNIRKIAKSNLGIKFNEESKSKISKKLKGRKFSKKHKENISKSKKGKCIGKDNSMYGKKHTIETKEKMSKSKKGKYKGKNSFMYGKKHSEITKEKISQKKKKSILQYDLDNNFIKEWRCVKDAANFLKKEGSCIYYCCENKYKTAYGFKWKYKEKLEE